jgi:hypothetical protein
VRTLIPLLLLCAGCDWAAADGPWNRPPPTPAAELGGVDGVVCSPDGRPVAGAPVFAEPADGSEPMLLQADEEGGFALPSLPPGSWTLSSATRHFSGERRVEVGAGVAAVELCFDSHEPRALVLRGPDAAWGDRVLERLRGFDLDIAHAGADDGDGVASLLSTPQGLADYELAAIGGGLGPEAIVEHDAAMNGLRDFLERGGGLYLSGDAWPLLEALAPGSLSPHGQPADHDDVLADVHGPLAGWLGADAVALPVAAGQALFDATGATVDVLVDAEVRDAQRQPVVSPLVLQADVLGGTVVYVGLRAPEPEAGEWWQGPSEAWGEDWDARAAVIDQLLLRL